MQHLVEGFADLSIRRACAFVGLGAAMVMLGLSFDIVLSLRMGAEIAALLTAGLVLSAWRVPRRDLRHSEVYALLKDTGLPRARLAAAETQAILGEILQARLLWHAERVAGLALGLWGLSLLCSLLR